MTAQRIDLLVWQLDLTWSLFEYHLQHLDDEACLWEPAAGSWTVRPDNQGRWVADWEVPEPDPVPTTSIGWLTWHIGYWWTTAYGHCFAGGAPEREQITWPGTAAATIEWLRGLKDDWRTALLDLTDADLNSTERTKTLPWGEPMELGNVAAWANVELTKNVSEVGLTLHLRKVLARSG